MTAAAPPSAAPPGPSGPSPSPTAPRLLRFADLLGELRVQAEAAHQARVAGVPKGPTTGLPTLDKVLGDVLEVGLHIVHGRPGSGKSAFAAQAAATCKFPALYVTCELAPVELLLRHTARCTGVFLDRLRSGELAPDDAVRLAEQAIAAAPQLAVVDASRGYLPPAQLLRFAEAARGTARHLLVVVDSIHSWSEGATTGLSEYDALNMHLAELRRIALQLGVPVLGVAERNRATMAAGGLSASAGTRKFEYGASSVVAITEDADPLAPGPALRLGQKAVTLVVEKNRVGSAGAKIKAVFDGALMKFTD